jgi:hypothetical protein
VGVSCAGAAAGMSNAAQMKSEKGPRTALRYSWTLRASAAFGLCRSPLRNFRSFK